MTSALYHSAPVYSPQIATKLPFTCRSFLICSSNSCSHCLYGGNHVLCHRCWPSYITSTTHHRGTTFQKKAAISQEITRSLTNTKRLPFGFQIRNKNIFVVDGKLQLSLAESPGCTLSNTRVIHFCSLGSAYLDLLLL